MTAIGGISRNLTCCKDVPLLALPPGKILEDSQYALWDLYQPQIIGMGIAFVLLLLLVLFLAGLNRQLNKTRLAMRDLNASLEEQVQERTAQLGAANAALTVEIGERLRAEAALRWSEARFRTIFASAAIGMAFLDLKGMDIQLVNPAMERFFHLTAAQLMQRGVQALTHPDDWLRDNKLWEELRTGRRDSYTIDMRFLRGDGAVAWGRLTVSIANRDADVVTGVIAAIEDVTERHRVAAQLTQARDAAEAANRAKSQFLANMSHELRTPLNAILGFSKLMVNAPNLSSTQAENLSTINRSGEHLLELINDVLDLAKLEARRTTLSVNTFDLYRALDDVIDLFCQRAHRKGLALRMALAADVPRFVYADERKLRQILINLLGNAVKFTAVGSVHLSVDTLARQADEHTACRVRFAVQDTGPSIHADDLELIFEPFVQANRLRATSDGTGLGLSISRQFARLMGGDLTVFSSGIAGQGSRFEAVLSLRLADVTTIGDVPDGPTQRALACQVDQSVGATPIQSEHTGQAQSVFELSSLPARWLANVRHAAALGDSAQLRQLATAVRETQPVLADRLCTWAADFKYEAILAALINVEENSDV